MQKNSVKAHLSKKEKRFTLFEKIFSLFGKIEWIRSVEKLRREVVESAREMGFTSYDASYLGPALHLKGEVDAGQNTLPLSPCLPAPVPTEGGAGRHRGEGGGEGVYLIEIGMISLTPIRHFFRLDGLRPLSPSSSKVAA